MVQSSLVGWWPLNEWSGGRANDLSGNDNHSTSDNSSGKGQYAPSGLTSTKFESDNNSYISVGNPGVLDFNSQNFTLSAWVYITEQSSRNSIIVRSANAGLDSAGISYALYELGGNVLLRLADSNENDTTTQSETSVEMNQWYHIAAVREGATAKIWINSELDSVGSTVEPDSNADAFYIGANPDGPKWFLDGLLADVRTYNRALSPQEIQHLYEIGSVDVATPPAEEDSAAVARYAFDDRSDPTTALDTFGSNDGTINGATYSTDSIRGLSMEFTGGSDAVTITNDSSLNTANATISIWVKPQNENGSIYDRAINNGGSMRFITRSGGDMNFSLSNAGGTTTVTGEYSLDTWSHQTVTWSDSGTLRIYTNGVEQDSASIGSVDYNNKDLTIGNRTDADFEQLDGFVDEVRQFGRELSTYEVHQLYNWGTRGIDRRHELIQK